MATSSIFASFNINDSRKADRFVTALEESVKEPLRTPEAPTPHVLTDKDKILALFGKKQESKGETKNE